MFLGHFGAGFAGKAAAPRVSLGTLFLAAQFADLLWPTLLLLGLERVEIVPGITAVAPLDFVSYPISHSLAMAVLWGLVFAAVVRLATGRGRAAVVLGVLVVSHWVLDLVVHRPDLPLAPGLATRVGLGLWASVPATVVAEGLVFATGLAFYLRATRARDHAGVWGLWGMVALLVLIYAGNLLGPPPPSAAAIAWAGQAQWLLVLGGWWVDRHREAGAGGGEPDRAEGRVAARRAEEGGR